MTGLSRGLLLRAAVALTATAAAAAFGLATPAGARKAAHPSRPVSCLEVKSRCVQRKGCSTALRNVLDECLVSSSSAAAAARRCPERCEWALVSLVSVEDDIGRDYLTCDCAGSEACLQMKSNISACTDGVQLAAARLSDRAAAAPSGGGGGESAPVVSCHLAWMLCQADTSCSTALVFYERFCADLWRSSVVAASWQAVAAADDDDGVASQQRCTRRCSNSVFVLYRQAKASRLKRCYCDEGDSTCARVRGNTARLCPQSSAAGAAAWSPASRLSDAAAPRLARTTQRAISAAAAAASQGLHSEQPAVSSPSKAADSRKAAAAEASAAGGGGGARASRLNVSLGALLALLVARRVQRSSSLACEPCGMTSASCVCTLL